LSATPDDFHPFVEAVGLMMRTEPNYDAADLGLIHVPVAIVLGEHDEFIKPDHAEYLARSIPDAQMIYLHGVSHFAPLQRPAEFNAAVVNFLDGIGTRKNEGLRR
jgi:pimeloyl-ACP methyl ester carboxylesterase